MGTEEFELPHPPLPKRKYMDDTKYPIKIRGKFIEEMTREELIEAVLWAFRTIENDRNRFNKIIELMDENP